MKNLLNAILITVLISFSHSITNAQHVTLQGSAESYSVHDVTVGAEAEKGLFRYNFNTGIYTYPNKENFKLGAGLELPIIRGTFVGISANGLIGGTENAGPEVSYYLTGDIGIRLFDQVDVMSGAGLYKENIYFKPLSVRLVIN